MVSPVHGIEARKRFGWLAGASKHANPDTEVIGCNEILRRSGDRLTRGKLHKRCKRVVDGGKRQLSGFVVKVVELHTNAAKPSVAGACPFFGIKRA